MIGYLTGTVAHGTVLVGGVGYTVHTPTPLVDGEQVSLHVHTLVRENDITLYGFPTPQERDLFTHLLKAPGVGGKVALGIMSLGPATLAAAITSRDAAILAKAPGIGAKKAASLLSSLNVPEDLLSCLAGPDAPGGTNLADLVDSLVTLGHDPGAARAALEAAAASGVTGEAGLLRAAMTTLVTTAA
jgi:Holliday junction DNA helicase RuvA